MRVTMTFPVNLPIARIDMFRWVTEMTTADYESFAPAHKAMGSFFEGSRFFMVNVEAIASVMIVQHYELIDHSPSHVTFYSPRSRGYFFRWLPVTFAVPWEMRLRAVSNHACELTCTIGADFRSPLLAALASLNGTRFFMKRHLAVEGAAFARHLEQEFTREDRNEQFDNQGRCSDLRRGLGHGSASGGWSRIAAAGDNVG